MTCVLCHREDRDLALLCILLVEILKFSIGRKFALLALHEVLSFDPLDVNIDVQQQVFVSLAAWHLFLAAYIEGEHCRLQVVQSGRRGSAIVLLLLFEIACAVHGPVQFRGR